MSENVHKKERCLCCTLLGARGVLGLILIFAIGALLLFAWATFSSSPLYILIFVITSYISSFVFIYQLNKAIKNLQIRDIKDEKINQVANEEKQAGKKRTCLYNHYLCCKQRYLTIFDPDGSKYLIKTSGAKNKFEQ